MKGILRFCKYLVLTLLLSVAMYAGWCFFAYSDISKEDLVVRYGGDNLHHLDVDGTSLYYRLDGQPLGEAPALVMIHSHYFNSRMWQGWVQELSADFTLIRYDLSSHGLTGPDAKSDYSMARDLEMLHALVQDLGLERFALAGSSLGGNIAFYYASAHPELVSHLVLVNSGGLKREQNSRRNASSVPDWFYRVFYFVPTTAYRAFIEWMVTNDSVVTEEMVEEFHAMFRREGNRKAEMARIRSFDVGEPLPVLADVTAPVLIQWGEDNPQLPTSQIARFQEALVNAAQFESYIYPGAGHLLPVELPQQSAVDVRKFILRDR